MINQNSPSRYEQHEWAKANSRRSPLIGSKWLLMLLVFCCIFSAHAQTVDKNFVDGQLLFALKPAYYTSGSGLTTAEDVLSRTEIPLSKLSQPFAVSTKAGPLDYYFLADFDDADNIDSFLQQLTEQEEIAEAYKVPMVNTSQLATPDDPDYLSGQQWYLSTVDAVNAWSFVNAASGSTSNVVVAVIDDAVDLSHPDLSANLWNSGDAPGNGDDDGNGFVDDAHGYDFADNDGDPTTPASANANFFSHGTHVSGIANGVTNNTIGISSLAYNVQLMALKCASDQSPNPRSFSILSVINGIYYAVDNGADIINMSLGTDTDYPPLETAVNYAHNNDVMVVAAAGNDTTDAPAYPAAYANSIAVAASDASDIKATFSNYGSWVDITAPGVSIYSTLPNNSYGNKSGTSMACPLVVSALALMKTHRPGIPNNFLVNCLLNNADNIDPINTAYAGDLGSGRLNANLAIQCTNGVIANIEVDDQSPCIGQTVTFTATSNPGSISYTWDFGDNTIPVTTASNTITHTYNGVWAPATVTLTVSDGSVNAVDQTDLIVTTCQLDEPSQAHWYFGNQLAVDFSNGFPLPDQSACINGTMQGVKEVAASVSDDNGNLLFYTDGERVWDNTHALINNNLLIGNYSMSNGVIITPVPGSTEDYYIFHTDGNTPGGSNRGLHYSSVNTTGGTVSITSVNTALNATGYNQTPLGAMETGERITVVPSCDGYWVITTAQTATGVDLIIFSVTSTGIQFDNAFPIGQGLIRDYEFGFLKASPDGLSIALAIDSGQNMGIYMMDFDAANGTLSNIRQLTGNTGYGIAFSPDSKILYVTGWYNIAGIWQYDLTQTNPTGVDITSHLPTAQGFAGIQLGPDKKIYVKQNRFGHPYISTIHFPNSLSQPGFTFDDVDLNPNNQLCQSTFPSQNMSFGLPNMIDAKPTLVNQDTMVFTASNCYTYDFEGTACSNSYLWDFGDPASSSNSASTQNPSHTFSGPGTYTVSLTTSSQTISETITIADPIITILGPDSLCIDDGGVYNYYADAGTGQYTYSWSIVGGLITSNSTQSLIDVEWTSPLGQLSVEVTDTITGCSAVQTLQIFNDCPTTCSNCTQTNDEVVNGDFEQGTAGAGTFISQLQQLTQQTCNTVGTYFIGSEAQDKCATLVDDLWDHTEGTRDGHYLIVDDHSSLAAYYVWAQQNISIVKNETYHFSFWHMRNLTAARPGWYQEFVLVVNGHFVDTISTQGAPANQWVEYCADWVSDQTTSQATIGIARINNNGNNLPYGLDDITFGTCVDCSAKANFTTGLHTIDDPWRSFFDQSTSSGTIIAWEWDFGDPASGVNNISTLQNPWHRFTGNGTYTVCLTVTAMQGGKLCTSTVCKSITIYREHVPLPCKNKANFDVNFNFNNSCTVSLIDQSTVAGGAITQWDWNVFDQNGTLLLNSNQQNVTFNRNFGSYVKICLEVTGNNGGCVSQYCKEYSNLAACSITDPGGPLEMSLNPEITLFPNPTQDLVQIVTSFDAEPAQVILMDLSGKRLDVNIIQESNRHFSIDLTGLPSGVYHLGVQGSKHQVYQSIIKE